MMNRQRVKCSARAPSVRDMLTTARMGPASGHCHYSDQPGNDIALAWYLWDVRNEPELFARECRTIPPHQLVSVLWHLRKIVRHPEWKLALRFKPLDEHFAVHREYLQRESWTSRTRQDYIADLLKNTRRYARIS